MKVIATSLLDGEEVELYDGPDKEMATDLVAFCRGASPHGWEYRTEE
jgi:hypothetical protein